MTTYFAVWCNILFSIDCSSVFDIGPDEDIPPSSLQKAKYNLMSQLNNILYKGYTCVPEVIP